MYLYVHRKTAFQQRRFRLGRSLPLIPEVLRYLWLHYLSGLFNMTDAGASLGYLCSFRLVRARLINQPGGYISADVSVSPVIVLVGYF